MKTLVRLMVATMILGASFSVSSWTQTNPSPKTTIVNSDGGMLPCQYTNTCGGTPKAK